MVQIIDPNQDGSVGEEFGKGITSGLQMLMKEKLRKMHQKRQAEALETVGLPGALAGLDPAVLKEFAKGKAQEQTIRSIFGGDPSQDQSKPALHQPEGTQAALQPNQLGISQEGMEPKTQQAPTGADKLKQMSNAQLQVLQGIPALKDIAKTELDMRAAGKKESFQLGSARYKSNLPLYKEDQKKLEAMEREGINLQRIKSINASGKLPSGLGRWNVDFDMGELRIPFAANAETQAFVKTINDWTVNAKDSFGARVTNFELKRFMKRLPSLLNTTEGRRQIIRQMEIINELNQLHKQGITDAFDKAGGLRKLDYDQAQRISKRENKVRIEQLKKEYTNAGKASPKQGAKKVSAPSGKVGVINPDGEPGYLPKAQVKDALKAGYKLDN